MTTTKKITLTIVAATAVTLLLQIPVTRATAQGNLNRQLRLVANFTKYAGPAIPNFGDQFTLTGTVAPFDTSESDEVRHDRNPFRCHG